MSYNAATKTMTFGPAGKAAASATKKPRAAKKATVVEDAQERVTQEERDSFNEHVDGMFSKFNETFSYEFSIKYPIMGMVVNLVTTGLGLYTGIQAAAWLGFGAAVLTGSMFIGFVVSFIAGFSFAIQALRAGAAAGAYFATGKFEHDYQRAKSWVSDKLSPSKFSIFNRTKEA